MRVFCLTDLGKRIASTKEGSTDEMRVLQYLKDNKTGTDAELEVVAERYVIRKLLSRGLIKELTT
jgi:hypothetical protein